MVEDVSDLKMEKPIWHRVHMASHHCANPERIRRALGKADGSTSRTKKKRHRIVPRMVGQGHNHWWFAGGRLTNGLIGLSIGQLVDGNCPTTVTS